MIFNNKRDNNIQKATVIFVPTKCHNHFDTRNR